MFYGADIPLPEAHQQMSTALDAGCNFLDTAEMYPIPQAAEHAGRSEAVVGSWLKQHRRWGRVAAPTTLPCVGQCFQLVGVACGPTQFQASHSAYMSQPQQDC